MCVLYWKKGKIQETINLYLQNKGSIINYHNRFLCLRSVWQNPRLCKYAVPSINWSEKLLISWTPVYIFYFLFWLMYWCKVKSQYSVTTAIYVLPWGKNCTRAEICRHFNSHFFPCFYREFKGKNKFLEISTNFSSCTVITPSLTTGLEFLSI